MKISIKTLTAKTFQVSVPENSTLSQLREAVQDSQGVPPDQQRFMILTEGELTSLPFGDPKINEFVNDPSNEKRYLKGKDEPLTKLGVTETTTLLQVLTLRGASDDEPVSMEQKIQDFFHRSIFDKYVLTLEEVKEVSKVLRDLTPKGESDSLASYTCNCLGHALYPQAQYQEQNLANVFFALDTLKTTTDPFLADALFSIPIGAAKANIDGLVLKMLEKGALEVGKRFYVERQLGLDKKYDDNEYPTPFARTKLQARAVEFLQEIQDNHEPIRPKVADILYGETFRKDGVFVYPSHGFHDFSPEKYLWEEAWKVYNAENKQSEYTVTIKAIKGLKLAAKDSNGFSDPYFVVGQSPEYKKEMKQQIKSAVIKKTLNPEWDLSKEKRLDAKIAGGETCLIQVYDHDLVGSEFMGSLSFSPRLLYSAMKAEKKDTVTIVGPLDSIETKKSGSKYRDVEGYLVFTLAITRP